MQWSEVERLKAVGSTQRASGHEWVAAGPRLLGDVAARPDDVATRPGRTDPDVGRVQAGYGSEARTAAVTDAR